jgi:hypothetical protein
MKNFLLVLIACMFATSSFAGQTWNSTFGKIVFDVHDGDNIVIGKYNAADNGKLFLLKKGGDNYFGFWTEKSSKYRCSSQVGGSYYWGRMLVRGSERSFSGKWGYCNRTPSKKWNGTFSHK